MEDQYVSLAPPLWARGALGIIDRERLRRGCRRPPNGVRHAETVAWQLHVVNVLDRFGGFWRWMTLSRSLSLRAAAVRKRFQFLFALVCENHKIASQQLAEAGVSILERIQCVVALAFRNAKIGFPAMMRKRLFPQQGSALGVLLGSPSKGVPAVWSQIYTF